MFKRVTWMSMGLVAGLGASKWLERKARRKLARLLPVHDLPVRAGTELVERVRDRAQERAYELREALDAGRAAMQAREDELRGQIYGRPRPAPVIELRPLTNPTPRISLPPSRRGRRTRRGRNPAL